MSMIIIGKKKKLSIPSTSYTPDSFNGFHRIDHLSSRSRV